MTLEDLECDFCAYEFGSPDPRVLYIKQQEMKAGKASMFDEAENN